MKINQTLLILAGSLVVSGAGAEVGGRYEDSVRNHGVPIGKMVKKDQVVYLFQDNGVNAREVYNREGICIKSDFLSAAPVVKEEIVEPAPEPVPEPVLEPVQEIALEPVMETAQATQKSSFLWVLLALLPILGVVAVFMTKGNKGKGLCLDLASTIGRRNPSLPDPIQLQNEPVIEKDVKTRLPKEASARLSRNEICFYKALQEAVKDSYMISFHVGLEQIVDLENPDYKEHMPAYKNLQPVFVNFVLHNPLDTSVAAVILLCDRKNENAYKIYRREFLEKIFKDNNTKLIEINENSEYSKEKIEEIIFKKGRKNAA